MKPQFILGLKKCIHKISCVDCLLLMNTSHTVLEEKLSNLPRRCQSFLHTAFAFPLGSDKGNSVIPITLPMTASEVWANLMSSKDYTQSAWSNKNLIDCRQCGCKQFRPLQQKPPLYHVAVCFGSTGWKTSVWPAAGVHDPSDLSISLWEVNQSEKPQTKPSHFHEEPAPVICRST